MNRFLQIFLSAVFLFFPLEAFTQSYKGIKKRMHIQCLGKDCTGEQRMVYAADHYDREGRLVKSLVYNIEMYTEEIITLYKYEKSLVIEKTECSPYDTTIYSYRYKDGRLVYCLQNRIFYRGTEGALSDSVGIQYFYNEEKMLEKILSKKGGMENEQTFIYNDKGLLAESKDKVDEYKYYYNEKDSLVRQEHYVLGKLYLTEHFEYDGKGRRSAERGDIYDYLYYYNKAGLLVTVKTKFKDGRMDEIYTRYEYEKW